MNLRIFTVHHRVPDTFVASPIFSPFITGLTFGSRHPIFITDEDAVNISDRPSYAEMRGHYYVWKNMSSELDYVGFHHYRRAFLFDFMMEANGAPEVAQMCAVKTKDRSIPPQPIDRPTFDRYLEWLNNWDLDKISLFKKWIESFDIIVPRAQPLPNTIGEEYARWHFIEDWQSLIEILQHHRRFNKLQHRLDFEIRYLIPCNMFLMRASIFHDYMEFWHDVMTALEGLVEVKRDPYQARVFGFLSERVFTMYMHHLRIERPMLRVAELPYLVYEPGMPPLSSAAAMQSSLAVGLSLVNQANSDRAVGAELRASPIPDGAAASRSSRPEIARGSEAVDALTRLIRVVGNAVAENEARIETLTREAGERATAIDAEIARLHADADERAALARIQDERQVAGEASIAALRTELAARDDRLAALEAALAEERAANAAQLELLRAQHQSTAEAIIAQLEPLRRGVERANGLYLPWNGTAPRSRGGAAGAGR